MRKALLFVISATLLAATAAYAHHSYGATYDTNKQIELKGKLVQFVYRNPHSFVHVEVKDDKGQVVRWAVEWGGGGQLGRQGVTRETLKPGDKVTIVGNPGRNPDDHRLRMLRLRRAADGYTWGTRPGETFD